MHLERDAMPTQYDQIVRGVPDLVGRPYALLAFDWDGTAVVDRRGDAAPLAGRIARLLGSGALVAIITGTNFGNIDRQCTGLVAGRGDSDLFVLSDRGSEVYTYGEEDEPLLLWRRVASPTEEAQLTAAADLLAERLIDRTGLEVVVISDRLNRRKIDLIPLPEWSDPPKSEFASLGGAVEERLRDAGFRAGLRGVFALAVETAAEVGLVDARITSDLKHIEIGLTDKSDAMRWLLEEIVRPREIGIEEILIAGDEFGPIAGFEGSDARLLIPEIEGAMIVSVGPEPEGVPEGVIHLGGGPPLFNHLLEVVKVAEPGTDPLPRTLPLKPTDSPTWSLVEEGFNLAREHEIEALFTISNGYLGTRGSLAEGSSLSAPATYIAGIFSEPLLPRSVPGLARGPDWLQLGVFIEGAPLRLEGRESIEHRRILDLWQGILWREWRARDEVGRVTRIHGCRLASLADRHLLIQLVELRPENYGSRVRLLTRIADPVRNDAPLVEGQRVGFAARTTLWTPEGVEIVTELEELDDELIECWEGRVEPDETYLLERLVSIYTTRETDDPEARARAHLEEVREGGIERLLRDHLDAWRERWHYARIGVEGDEFAERALHFAAYHLIGAADPRDEYVSVGARALTGEAYKGHVFWDTEIFMLPFYTLTHPESARALLSYRYHTLAAAREKARLFGYRGALFAWESGIDGLEATPAIAHTPDGGVVRIRSGEEEHHISADIAYAVWQYWTLTGDDEFFRERGAELILETARFWASRGRVEGDGHFHIRRVIGPDEYHEGVDDNAFTNLMARWNLERGVETARILRERWPGHWHELVRKLELTDSEIAGWARYAGVIYTGFDQRTGLFEQFAGFFDLEEIDLEEYEPRSVPIDLILGRERTQRSQVIKQADVVLLLYLFWDELSPNVRRTNFDFYEPRCGHGSSLSPGIHGLIASRLGYLDLAEEYFRQTAEIDLANNMGNAAGGVHIAALGSLWQLAVFGSGGLYPQGADGIRIAPQPLPGWRGLDYRFRYRGRTVRVEIDTRLGGFEVTLEEGAPLVVDLSGEGKIELEPGRPRVSGRLDDREKEGR